MADRLEYEERYPHRKEDRVHGEGGRARYPVACGREPVPHDEGGSEKVVGHIREIT